MKSFTFNRLNIQSLKKSILNITMILPFLLISIFSQTVHADEDMLIICDPVLECFQKPKDPIHGSSGSGSIGYGNPNPGGDGNFGGGAPSPTPEEIKAKCLQEAEQTSLLDQASADMKHYSRLKNNCKWVAGFPTGGATTLCIEISNSLLNANNHVIAAAKSAADFKCNNP